MKKTIEKQQKRDRRHGRIRSRVVGTDACPRLAVFKSNRYISAQLINDEAGATLAAATSQTLAGAKGKPMTEAATLVGKEIADKAQAANIKQVVFDRGGFIYTGVVKAVAEGAREGGLTF